MSRTIRDSGLITYIDPDADKPLLEIKTLQCVHCGGHFPHQPGSGITRGFCTNCNGPVCGKGCAECIPEEQLLENIEKGRPDDFKPVSVGTLWLPGTD